MIREPSTCPTYLPTYIDVPTYIRTSIHPAKPLTHLFSACAPLAFISSWPSRLLFSRFNCSRLTHISCTCMMGMVFMYVCMVRYVCRKERPLACTGSVHPPTYLSFQGHQSRSHTSTSSSSLLMIMMTTQEMITHAFCQGTVCMYVCMYVCRYV